jgi:AraC family transcriptional regulator, regulatory protein of adaptative response / DNA-3-methyladenine glycosylase II
MMSDEQCYRAVLSQDARFDGVFFVGVSSTGIYCRTVCSAKTPRAQNCAFYPSAAAAERAGYRPCLRCRPELAPGQARVDAVGRLAAAAASHIEEGSLTQHSVSELASLLGISCRHLRRVFQQEFGVSPIQLAQTQRLLLAKQLLSDSHLSVAEIAFASGFSSVRRLNALFQKNYRLKPSALRQRRALLPNSQPNSQPDSRSDLLSDSQPDSLTCEVAYRPPFDWQGLLDFLRVRASAGVEVVTGDHYLRTVQIGEYQGWIQVSPVVAKHLLQVEISAALVAVTLPILNRVKTLFDLAADPVPISNQLGVLAMPFPGLRVPGAFNPFEIVVRAILGQQVSIKAATTLMARLIGTLGPPIETPIAGLTHLTPMPAQVAQASVTDLTALGILPLRANSILAIARALTDGSLRLESHAELETTIARLKTFPGIGDWTAQYIAMRVLDYPDAFPYSDLALRKALNMEKPEQMLQIAESWRPWRAYAAMHLWKSLEAKVG